MFNINLSRKFSGILFYSIFSLSAHLCISLSRFLRISFYNVISFNVIYFLQCNFGCNTNGMTTASKLTDPNLSHCMAI